MFLVFSIVSGVFRKKFKNRYISSFYMQIRFRLCCRMISIHSFSMSKIFSGKLEFKQMIEDQPPPYLQRRTKFMHLSLFIYIVE